MSSMIDKIFHAQKCSQCRIYQPEGKSFKVVENCAPCSDAMKARDERHQSMPLEDFICEVVNGRADLTDARNHYESLYERYVEDMPYGVAKARDGDPYEWLFERLMSDYEHLIEEEESA